MISYVRSHKKLLRLVRSTQVSNEVPFQSVEDVGPVQDETIDVQAVNHRVENSSDYTLHMEKLVSK